MNDLAVMKYSEAWCKFDPKGAASRIEALEAKLETFDWFDGYFSPTDKMADRIAELEAKLQRVEALPDSWILMKVDNPSETGKTRNLWIDRLVDELRQALGEQE